MQLTMEAALLAEVPVSVNLPRGARSRRRRRRDVWA